MKLLLDNIVFTLQRTGGISIVWQQHLHRLQADPSWNPTYLEYANSNIQRAELDLTNVQTMPYRQFERYRVPDVCPHEPTIFHSSYFRVLPKAGVKNVTTVHDLTYHYYRHGLAKMVHLWEEERAMRHSDHVICISENTRRDLLHHYPWLKEDGVSVVYNGVSEVYCPLATIPQVTPFARGEYLLYVGARHVQYKRFDLALATARNARVPLVFVGEDVTAEETKLLNETLGPSMWHAVVHATASDINVLYNGALALIYPSDYEGFGLPVIEAQQAHCPVIAQRRSSIPEVGGDAVLLSDTMHPAEQMTEFVRDLLSGRISCDAIVQDGVQNAKRFSWDNTFKQTTNIYRGMF